MLLRNGTLRGKPVHLNMGGFVYTNRQSLSVGLVLPADNLHEHFGGDPNLLMEWFENLPALRPWLRGGPARRLRGQAHPRRRGQDIPHLIDDGLAIGGAASAIGIDFPYPNFTGPATAMGLLLARAACRIRAEGGGFTPRRPAAALPGAAAADPLLAGRGVPAPLAGLRQADAASSSAATSTWPWARPTSGPGRAAGCLTQVDRTGCGCCWHVAGPGHWRELQADLRHLVRALRLREVRRPARRRAGCCSTARSTPCATCSAGPGPTCRRPATRPAALRRGRRRRADRAAAPAAAALVPALRPGAGGGGPAGLRQRRRSRCATSCPARSGCWSGRSTCSTCLPPAALGLAAGVTGGLLAWLGSVPRLRSAGPAADAAGPLSAATPRPPARPTDLTPGVARPPSTGKPGWPSWPTRRSRRRTSTCSGRRRCANKDTVVEEGLWHVCPAHVYEARVDPQGQLQVVVNFENCIKCETCWRTSDLVDWGRDGQHRFIYAVHVAGRGAAARRGHAAGAGPAGPAAPRRRWEPAAAELAEPLHGRSPAPPTARTPGRRPSCWRCWTELERKLEEFDAALAEEPRTVDRARAEYLEMLARYAQQLAGRVVEMLRGAPWPQPAR